MAEVVRPYRGISAEERRAERRARLIEAGLDVLGGEGLANTTMTAVCARAGLTERYFYESFDDRDALLGAIYDALTEETDQAMLAALEGAAPDLYERCRAAVGAMIGVLTEDPRKARAYVEAAGSATLKERRARATGATAAMLAAQMRERHGLRAKRYGPRLRLATLTLVGGTAEAVASWLDGAIDLTVDELVDETARLCVAAAETVRSA